MSFKFKPKPTIDREATEQELKNVKEAEKMLKEEKKLPSTSQMVRDLAVTHWKSLKAFMKGKHVIVPQEVAEERWEICKQCPLLKYDEVNPDTDKKDGRCIECGCFMNVKCHYATAECPKGYWKKFKKNEKKA
jgi:hypothetical protein|tara:strand:+ start:693 stop:1091 length:399 start_codon:yes stop_codon:yes gene_type:complete